MGNLARQTTFKPAYTTKTAKKQLKYHNQR